MEAVHVVRELKKQGLTIACAESLTGGLVCAHIVDIPGASQVLRGGVTVYATDSKASVVGVEKDLLDAVGPVDKDVALQMARGVREMFASDVAVATTGVAGPGAADGHDAGTVWIAAVGAAVEETRLLRISGDRCEVRQGAVEEVFSLLMDVLVAS